LIRWPRSAAKLGQTQRRHWRSPAARQMAQFRKGTRVRLFIIALWNGRLPLARAFWHYAILYGTIASITATGAAVAGFALGLPGLLAFAVHLLPLPYVFIAAVGVFRSANRYSGPPIWARLAEAAIVIWAGLMVLV
jgi:hypothetical protein